MPPRKRKPQPPIEEPQPPSEQPPAQEDSQPPEEAPIPVEGTPFWREKSDSTVENLKQQLEQVIAERDEYREGWQRALADFSNYKRRIERDQAQMQQTATINAVRRYLEVLDDLERALKNRPQDGDGAAWASGIELIHRKLLAALEADNITLMDAEGQFFDPNLHEALTQEDSPNHQSGQIIEVVQPGYLLGERVVRPARVRVAR